MSIRASTVPNPVINTFQDGSKVAWEEKMSKRFAVVDASSEPGIDSGKGEATNKLAKATTM